MTMNEHENRHGHGHGHDKQVSPTKSQIKKTPTEKTSMDKTTEQKARLKGIVQRKLRWVEIGINQQVLL